MPIYFLRFATLIVLLVPLSVAGFSDDPIIEPSDRAKPLIAPTTAQQTGPEPSSSPLPDTASNTSDMAPNASVAADSSSSATLPDAHEHLVNEPHDDQSLRLDFPSSEIDWTQQSEENPGIPHWGGVALFRENVAVGEKQRITWYPDQSALGLGIPTPVMVARGASKGPALCLTAAIHGDELNGVEMIRRLLLDVDPAELQGMIIGIPIVNVFGFIRNSRYLPDRRDLNRYFPGDAKGSSASRLAFALFDQLKAHCDLLVDIHTGSFHRTNLPQLRADLSIAEVVELTRDFGATTVLQSRPPSGSLRRAAVTAGIPAVTFEAGEPLRFQQEMVDQGVKALETLLRNRGMVNRFRLWKDPQPVFYESRWVRSDNGGILLSNVELGDLVREGAVLATVTDPINNTAQEIRAPFAGKVLGMALNQVVMPGFAAVHLGRATSEQEAVTSAHDVENEPAGESMDPEDPDAPARDHDDETTNLLEENESGQTQPGDDNGPAIPLHLPPGGWLPDSEKANGTDAAAATEQINQSNFGPRQDS